MVNQLVRENLVNIAAQDTRLVSAVAGNIAMGSGTAPVEFNPTGMQANFVGRSFDTATGKWVNISNSHLVVKP